MKISRNNLIQRLLKTMISLLLLGLAIPADAQVVDCSQRVGGGLLFNFQGDWCGETAADSTGTQTGVTCRACLAEKLEFIQPRGPKAATLTATTSVK
jgi:hypothetical protein